MRNPERHPLPDQPLRDVRREGEPGRSEGRQAVGVEHERGHHAGDGRQEQLQLLDRVDDAEVEGLAVGESRELTRSEVASLRAAVGL